MPVRVGSSEGLGLSPRFSIKVSLALELGSRAGESLGELSDDLANSLQRLVSEREAIELAFVGRAEHVGFTKPRQGELPVGGMQFGVSFVLAFVRDCMS